MRVILINPPSPYLANDAAYPPSGLMYVAAALERIGHEPEIIDLTGGLDWEGKISGLEADLFGITCVTPNFKIVQKIASLLPEGKSIIIGGAHPTFLPEDVLLNIRCHAVIRGEAEAAVKQIMGDLAEGKLKRIYDGGLVAAGDIPKPSRHLINLHKYHPGGEDTTPIYTSRGCPYNCVFCSKVTGNSYRIWPIDKVMEEVREVMGLGFKSILFGDDNMAIQGSRLAGLLSALKPLGIMFRLNQDAKGLDEKIIALAAEVGCTEISFGIESGSERLLRLMNKKASVEDNKRAIRLTKAYGMKAKAYFIVNFPGETEKSVEETILFAEETRVDKWLLSSFAPLPGSLTFHHPQRYGINWLSPNWEDYYLVGKNGMFKPCFTTAELSFERQIYLHDRLYQGLREILG